ncbi:MAG: transposase [Clostridia bacterium]|nr:transposase [Clostridia bacterium]
MKNQQSFADLEYEMRKKKTKREIFLDRMDGLVPWEECVALAKPFCPEGRRGRPARDPEMMLRMYLLRRWFHLSDTATEDAAYDSFAFRKFLHLSFFDEQTPDATTLGKFRRKLDAADAGKRIEALIDEALKARRLTLRRGSFTDAAAVRLKGKTKGKGNVKKS